MKTHDQFDEKFYDDMSKLDVPFKEYFETLGGHSIRIFFLENKILIMDSEQQVIGELAIGRSAKAAGLDLSKMLKSSYEPGDKHFGVLLNGYNNQDWLFAVDVIAIL